MKHLSTEPWKPSHPVPEPTPALPDAADAPRPLSPSRRAELWSGRLAMVGFMTTVVAIAARATL